MTYYAHIRKEEDQWLTQSVEDHCLGVANLATLMAKPFHAESWAYLCGLWHDIGKYSAAFQDHILSASGMRPDVKDPGRIDHSSAGGQYAKMRLGCKALPIAYCICGHHAGLMDFNNEGVANLMGRLSSDEQLRKVKNNVADATLPPLSRPLFDNDNRNPKAWHLWIKMLYSCLVDADYLDTERFMDPSSYASRAHYDTLPILKRKLDIYLQNLEKMAPKTAVNTTRAMVQNICRETGATTGKGIYTLTVPTGGGKTLSSMVWAMEHAMKNHCERIIIAIPYTSIVVQTADKLRQIFGRDNVVEHHSNIDFDKMPDALRHRMKLATENWDAPIVVTTNVQFFESLFSNKPSRCRKLHNIVHSVVILDEVQMLPTTELHPIIDAIGSLNNYFDVSFLFTTATQPVFSNEIGSGQSAFNGIPSHELIPDTDKLSKQMSRVEVNVRREPMSVDALTEELSQYRQVLCVVNKRADARAIYDAMPDKSRVVHLSRMMCQSHIMDKIQEVRQLLDEDAPIIVISTQLIEAGVDIDFPVVYRAMAGLDSIAQAAGRCNREGKLEKGHVTVFSLEGSSLRGVLRKGADTMDDLIRMGMTDYLSPATLAEYFKRFYRKVNTTDKGGVIEDLYRETPQFESAARDFKMIDDNSLTVYVPYRDNADLLNRLLKGDVNSDDFKRLQRFSVGLPVQRIDDLMPLGAEQVGERTFILTNQASYNDDIGLDLENHWLEEDLILG